MLTEREQQTFVRFRRVEPRVLIGFEELQATPELVGWWERFRSRARQGYHLVLCGDCDYCEDGISHHWKVIGRRPQLHALGGGTLLLDPTCPVNETEHLDLVLLKDMKFVRPKKRLEVAILRVDFPCGFGRHYGYSPERTLLAALRAKEYLVDEGWGVDDVALLYHLEKYPGHELTYLINEEAALAEVRNPLLQA